MSFSGLKNPRVLVVAGRSGGHIFPALAFLDRLKERYNYVELFLVLPKENQVKSLEISGCKIDYVSVPRFKTGFSIKNIVNIIKLFKGFIRSVSIIIKFHPDIIVGFGSLASVFVVMCGWAFRIKTIIHEQNVIPGRANRFVAAFVDRIAFSFEESKGYLNRCQHKIVFTGNPLRKSLIKINKTEALGFFGFNADKITILVMGGSQGSHSINIEFLRAASIMQDRFQVIHLTGSDDSQFLRNSYRDLNIKVGLFSFFDQMEYAYSACDFVISRSGAITISELIAFELPAILIPYPYAYEHQWQNANVLKAKGCADIIKEEDLKKNVLSQAINNLIVNPDRLKDMRRNYCFFKRIDASELLVNEVVSLN